MWFINTAEAESIAVVGYFDIEGDVLGMCWMSEAKAPLLLLSLASGMLQALTPDFSQAHTGESDCTLTVGFDFSRHTGTYR